MKWNLWIYLIFFSCFASGGLAQHTVKGVVTDEHKQPLPQAIVMHLKSDNEQLIHSVMTDEQGLFILNDVRFGPEKIKITGMGYRSVDITALPASGVVEVELHPLTVDLGEVAVVAKSQVAQKKDRLVFHISNMNLTEGSNTLDLLKFTPLLSFKDDRLSMLGKAGVLVYINGRKSNLSGEGVESYLKSLPAQAVQSVEIITHPNSTIRREGDVGIINLVLKKNENEGVNGVVSVSDNQSYYNGQDASLYLSAQKNKWNLSANLHGLNDKQQVSSRNEYRYYHTDLKYTENNRAYPVSRYIGGSVAGDYHFSPTQTLGIALDSWYKPDKNRQQTETSYFALQEAIADSSVYSDIHFRTPSFYGAANVNYRIRTDEKGSLISFDFDYLRNNKKQTIDNVYASSRMFDWASVLRQFRQKSKEVYNNYAGKVEYTHVFDKQDNLTSGVEGYKTAFHSDFFYGDWRDNEYVSDPAKTNRFDYDETYVSAYASYAKDWNEKWQTTVGARVEYLHNRGVQKITDQEVGDDYVNFLPALSVFYKPTANHSISYNFSSSVSRPGYYSLNPFRFYLTPTTYKDYNPNLKPVPLYMSSLQYNLKGHYTFVFNYIFAKNCTNNFYVPVDDTYTKYVNANYGDSHVLSYTFNWNDSYFNNRLTLNANLYAAYCNQTGRVETLRVYNKSWSGNVGVSASVLLSSAYRWNLDGNYYYTTKMKLAQEDVDPFHTMSFSLRKTWKNGISLHISATNLVALRDIRSQEKEAYFYKTDTKRYRRFGISVRVPFGNAKAKGAQSRSSASYDSSRRLKE